MNIINPAINYLQNFADKAQATYHMNPWIFAFLFFGSAIPLYYGYYRIGKSALKVEERKLKRKKVDSRELKTGIAISVIAWCIPYLYVILFGKLPLKLWLVFIAFLIVLGAVFIKTLFDKVKKAKNEIVEEKKSLGFKKILKAIWDEFVYGGHFLALGDAVTMYVIAVILGAKITWDFPVVVYLCVFAANLFNRADEAEHDELTNPVRVKVMKKYIKYFNPIVIFCALGSVGLLLYYSGYKALLFAILIVVIAVLYSTIFKDMTKYIVGFKSFVAALFYALMVFLLVIYYKAPFNTAVILIFAFYYLRIFISNAACDIKDIEGDKIRGLKTFAVKFGEKGAGWFLNILNVLSGLIVVFGIRFNFLPMFSVLILLTIPYTSVCFYLNSKIKNKEFFTNVIVDGEFLLWLPYLIIGKAIF